MSQFHSSPVSSSPLTSSSFLPNMWASKPNEAPNPGYDHDREGISRSKARFPAGSMMESEGFNFFPDAPARSQPDIWSMIVKLTAKTDNLCNQNHYLQKRLEMMEDRLLDGLGRKIQTLNDNLTKAIDGLSAHPSPGTSSKSSKPLPLPSLNIENYPEIKYWTKKKFITAKKNKEMSTGLASSECMGKTTTWYVETEDGDPISIEKVNAIREHARHFWQSLLTKGIAPVTWAQANLEAHNYYEHHMCERFPELSYGANNWKAHMIATDNYSSRYGKHVGRSAKVKNEPTATRLLKRSSPSVSSPMPERKKSKVANLTTDEPQEPAKETMDSRPSPKPLPKNGPLDAVFSNPAAAAKLITPPSKVSQVTSSTDMAPETMSNATTTSSTSTSTTGSPSADLEPTAAPATVTAATPRVQELPQDPSTNQSGPSKSKKAKAGHGNNTKSICKRDWVAQNPTGTEDEYTKHWAALCATGGDKEFIERAKTK